MSTLYRIGPYKVAEEYDRYTRRTAYAVFKGDLWLCRFDDPGTAKEYIKRRSNGGKPVTS